MRKVLRIKGGNKLCFIFLKKGKSVVTDAPLREKLLNMLMSIFGEKVLDFCKIVTDDEDRFSVDFYTENRKYHLTCTKNYLGCVSTCRKAVTGVEDQFLGNDLSDGKFNKETFERIKNDIIRMELVKLKIEYEIRKFY